MSQITCQFERNSVPHTFEHIELPAKLLDYFLRSNTSNINGTAWESTSQHAVSCVCIMTSSNFEPGLHDAACSLYSGSRKSTIQTRGSTGSSTLELVKMIAIRQKTPTSQLLSSGSMCFGLYSAEIVHSRRARAMMYT